MRLSQTLELVSELTPVKKSLHFKLARQRFAISPSTDKAQYVASARGLVVEAVRRTTGGLVGTGNVHLVRRAS